MAQAQVDVDYYDYYYYYYYEVLLVLLLLLLLLTAKLRYVVQIWNDEGGPGT